MTTLPLEVLELEPMASGNQCIRLTRCVTYETFGAYAEHLVPALEGQVMHTADGPDERVWTTVIDGGRFWLAFDEFDFGVSLEPCDDHAAAKVAAILARLRELRAAAG